MTVGLLWTPDLFSGVYRDVHTGEVDRYGKPVATRTLVGGPYDGALHQASSREGEAFVVDMYRAMMPVDAVVTADDEVESEGAVYHVEGRPVKSQIPGYPAVSHVKLVLKYIGPVTP